MTQWSHLWAYYPMKPETLIWKNILLYVPCSVIYNSQDLEAAQVSSSRGVNNTLWYTMKHYSAIKKKEVLPFETAWNNLESIMLSEITQPEKDM